MSLGLPLSTLSKRYGRSRGKEQERGWWIGVVHFICPKLYARGHLGALASRSTRPSRRRKANTTIRGGKVIVRTPYLKWIPEVGNHVDNLSES